MKELSATLSERAFEVDNPYLLLTKTDVVTRAMATRQPDLIRHTHSCTRTRVQRAQGWHCGCCSQCIDRRLACLAAGAEEHDPAMDYHVDVLSGERAEDRDKTMAVAWVRHATELSRKTPDDIAIGFNMELSRAARNSSDVAGMTRSLAEMHVRHGKQATGALGAWISRNAEVLVQGEVAPTSLVGLTIGREHRRPSWTRLATRICEVLDRGLPALCQKERPANEPRLQEICDGLLKGAEEKLLREFPFMPWGSRATKPDWSNDEAGLWVELKYVRKRADVRQVTEDIAADLTKYRDNGRLCLFVVYDPDGHILEKDMFLDDIARREGAIGHIVR